MHLLLKCNCCAVFCAHKNKRLKDREQDRLQTETNGKVHQRSSIDLRRKTKNKEED